MTEAEKEKMRAAFLEPGGMTLHAFSNRDGGWRARITCGDGSQLYTPLFHTPHGLFTWFAETAMLVRLFAGSDEPKPFVVASPVEPELIERMQKFVDSQVGVVSLQSLIVEEADET